MRSISEMTLLNETTTFVSFYILTSIGQQRLIGAKKIKVGRIDNPFQLASKRPFYKSQTWFSAHCDSRGQIGRGFM